MYQEVISVLFSGPAWIVFGVVLIVAEFAVPGAIVIFFGVGAVAVGVLTSLGILVDLTGQFLAWAVLSLIMVLFFRRKGAEWFPSLERYDPKTDEMETVGKIVEVLADVKPDADTGRVRFQGSSWMARSTGAPVYEGAYAKIVARENLLLLVEPSSGPSDADSDRPDASGAPRSDDSYETNPY